MRKEHVHHMVSPVTGERLNIEAVEREEEGNIIEGALKDDGSGSLYPIVNSIPRFVGESNYADSFGAQWKRYRRIQLDSFNGSTLTKDRFYSGTGWEADELRGKRVLEAGCGAGRFSEIMLEAGAELFSFDYSTAVDAAWENNSRFPDWSLCQADIFAMPYREGSFDYVFCYGVLQHTPDPKGAFRNLVRYLKPGGKIAVDVYAKETRLTRLAVKYWYRPITKRLPRRFLFKLCEFYLPLWIPIDSLIQKIPLLGKYLCALVPCWNKSDLPLGRQHQVEWTILDTFDAFSPAFDLPQTVEETSSWFEEADLEDIDVKPGGNGILGNGGKRPA